MKSYTVGIDIGGTKISGCLLDETYNIIFSKTVQTPSKSRDEVITEIKWLISGFLKHIPLANFIGIGVSTGGDVDPISGEILSATRLIPDWQNTKLGFLLRKEYNLPVFIENDGLLAIYAEHQIGAAKDYNYVVGLTIGTGLGGGIINNGRLLHGYKGSIANFWSLPVPNFIVNSHQIAHQNLEYFLSGSGLLRIAKIIEPQIEFIHPSDIFNEYKRGTDFAIKTFEVFFEYLKYLLNIIKSIILPEIVVIGGGVVTKNIETMENEFKKYSDEFPFLIIPSSLKNEAGMIGAGIYTKNLLKKN